MVLDAAAFGDAPGLRGPENEGIDELVRVDENALAVEALQDQHAPSGKSPEGSIA